MTLRKGESPGFYETPSTSTLRFVRTPCPTKAFWSFKATLHVLQTNALPLLAIRIPEEGTIPRMRTDTRAYLELTGAMVLVGSSVVAGKLMAESLPVLLA